MYAAVFGTSIPGRAAEKGLASYHVTDLRPFGTTRYQKVDERPAGGGPGMVMTAPVLAAATDAALALDPRPARKLIMTPVGKRFDHAKAVELAQEERLLIVATHYEGYDERFVEEYQCEEISLGDFVLSGGELAAMVVIDAVIRQLPGVLGNERGAIEDSFAEDADGLLEGPTYTKPREWRGREIPNILLSGDHAKIAAWRREQRLKRTRERRPDLLDGDTR